MPRKSLILAGGGMKVAFQAGVLQVWLDEAGLEFDHVDAASGGTFNLAMMCQGMSGTQIADNWRNLDPRAGVDINWTEYWKLFYAESMFTLDNYREHVFDGSWGLDWDRIRASPLEATFNAYNFSRHELAVLTPPEMSEDHLAACVSLPMWFPPVSIGGETYIDSVFLTDANVEEAIRRGADELWIIWTVSDKDVWDDGFVANYFQIIETSANGHFKRILSRVEANNAAFEAGGEGEFGRPIAIRMLKSEVELHYLINFSRDRITEAVNAGVLKARRWCAEEGIELSPTQGSVSTTIHQQRTRLWFTEEMKGFLSRSETDYDLAYRHGREFGNPIMFHLTITVDGINQFVADPTHLARAEGYVDCPLLGGRREVEQGLFNLFVSEEDPADKRMLYRLFFTGEVEGDPTPLTLSGYKDIYDDPGFDLWSDTTTLYTRILRGHVGPDDEDAAEVVATAIVRIHLVDFLRQLTTFRTEGPTRIERASAMARFGKLFLGKLWDVYARELLSSSPV